MLQRAHPHPDSGDEHAIEQPTIIRGVEDQDRAYEEWMAQWRDVNPEEEEHEWETVRESLQETRRALGQRLLFPE
jgi:hypothetical protein